MIALEVSDLAHRFGSRQVLHAVSFAVEAGSFAVLLGRNGAGKTTLFSLITGLYHARRGSVRVFGHAMRDASTAALAETGVVFQQPTLDLDLTAAENLRYHAALHGLDAATARMRAQEELDRLGVLDRRGDLVRTLSGGQKRRVEIARSLMHRPRLLLLDEPTTGLDVPGRRALAEHVRALCRTRGITVLWATHFLEEVADDDFAVVLDQGRLVRADRAHRIAREFGVTSIAAAFPALTEHT
jgi:ABC-2 type transport system ATP-binding protein